jgi:hypothetical protein
VKLLLAAGHQYMSSFCDSRLQQMQMTISPSVKFFFAVTGRSREHAITMLLPLLHDDDELADGICCVFKFDFVDTNVMMETPSFLDRQ